MSTLPAPSPKPTTSPGKRILPPNPKAAAVVALGFTVLLYLVELVDVVLPADLDQGGIVARSLGGLDGIAWAPLLHDGWGHLLSNTVAVLVFAFLAMAGGIGQWVTVTAVIWVLGGLGVWLTAPGNAVTVGASGLAFGWLAFLLVRGLFNRSARQLALAAVLFVIWGGMLWGVLPSSPNVSWQGHLFGALAGVLAAWLVGRADRARAARRPAGPAVGG
ncbi:Membrane associated serine protease, rhomboid family [Amycolatopsis arida]|uniref:Membrane associated serine protease, rhomboid family n=1 Tax=Amycolatopsis arida TaxID=587909 RepID=A0A1I5P017_9PSEU|nr:rhomboid family intramembrane serine protease [Amycolatopsis arida]TDX98306.1 membrane associated rhomboid family serine protease [Amycolatopsis arida]SFP27404.1 Membrane associated serine protease, rhomboid family [Amycolatopsis arida]